MSYEAADVMKLFVEVEEGTTQSAPAAPAEPAVAKAIVDEEKAVPEAGSSVTPNEDSIKLQYDLFCWHNFYEKCHELEKIEPFKDEQLERCSDVSSSQYSGPIVLRSVSFAKDDYYKNEVLPKVNQRYMAIHPEIEQEYEDFKEKREEQNQRNKEMLEKMEKRHNWRYLWLLCALLPIIACIVLTVNYSELAWLFFIGVPVAVGLGRFIFWVVCDISIPNAIIDDKEKYKLLSSDKGIWLRQNVFDSEEYLAYEKEKNQKYHSLLDTNIEYIDGEVESLRSLYFELKQQIPLPEKYCDEYHVNCLLALVLDRRADTLKEAINLLETETYRSNVLGSLHALNANLRQLNQKINDLGNLMHAGFSAVIKQNVMISNQLSALSYSASARFTTAMLLK